jgi:hypothetical protein
MADTQDSELEKLKVKLERLTAAHAAMRKRIAVKNRAEVELTEDDRKNLGATARAIEDVEQRINRIGR